MKLKQVIDRALTDRKFADELRKSALAGFHAGVGTDAWEDFVKYFAADPKELAMLRTLESEGSACTATTKCLLTTTSTADCTTTTTTTTTNPKFN